MLFCQQFRHDERDSMVPEGVLRAQTRACLSNADAIGFVSFRPKNKFIASQLPHAHGIPNVPPRDKSESIRLYRLAAATGHCEAQFRLGNMFMNGDAIAQDRAEKKPCSCSAVHPLRAMAKATAALLEKGG
jgi:TPR repeat protein